jgi:predicted enzyme related to lactoylglutathione lyase
MTAPGETVRRRLLSLLRSSRPVISFLTLFAEDIERTADVYRLLGLRFETERHGAGPWHLAGVADGLVVEIYPGTDTVSPGTMIGFDVADLSIVRATLMEAGVRLHRDIEQIGGARRLIAVDPEGRKLFLRETA